MVKCCKECIPVCDFCKYAQRFDYEFTGIVFCNEKKEEVDAAGWCDKFHCFRVRDVVIE